MDNQKKTSQNALGSARESVQSARWLDVDLPGETLLATGFGSGVSRAELRQHVSDLSAFLAGQGHVRWALCFDDTYHFVVSFLAVLHCGKHPIIPSHCLPASLNAQKSDFDAVLTDQNISLDLPVLQVPALVLKHQDEPLPLLTANRTFTLFTSGSTGQPKAVRKTLEQMDREVALLWPVLSSFADFDHVQSTVSHQHLYGLTFKVWLPLSLGLPFVSEIKTYQEMLVKSVNQRTLLISSPAFLKRLDLKLDTACCAGLVCAGGELDEGSSLAAQQWMNCHLFEVYGSTETGVIAWRTRCYEGSPWTPFEGIEFLLDQDEVRLLSPLLDTGSSFTLSDRFKFDEQGRFHLLGRKDRTVKLEEKRIVLDEIERRLSDMPWVDEAAVVVMDDAQRRYLGAVLVLNREGEIMRHQMTPGRFQSALRNQLQHWVEPVAIPRRWRFVKSLPLNPMGKRTAALLRRLFDAAG